jgi:hypothetical protein
MEPIDTLKVINKGHPVPSPVVVSIATAKTLPYQGKLVKIQNVTVKSDSCGFGGFSIWNGVGTDTMSIEDFFDPGIEPYTPDMNGPYDPEIGDAITYVQGPMVTERYPGPSIEPRDIKDICSSGLTGVEGEVPRFVNALDANRPNPFNPTTAIQFSLERGSNVDLKVYDTEGREVRTLHSGSLAAGPHTVTWDGTNAAGKDVSSGVYFYRLKAGEYENTKKMMLIR